MLFRLQVHNFAEFHYIYASDALPHISKALSSIQSANLLKFIVRKWGLFYAIIFRGLVWEQKKAVSVLSALEILLDVVEVSVVEIQLRAVACFPFLANSLTQQIQVIFLIAPFWLSEDQMLLQ